MRHRADMAAGLDAQEGRLRRDLREGRPGQCRQQAEGGGADHTASSKPAACAFSVTATLWAKSSRRAALLPASVRTSLAPAAGAEVGTLIERRPAVPWRSLADT